MERERKEKNIIIIALVVAIVSLSVAFAATLSSQLDITGNATIGNAKWDVHFESAETADSSDVTPTVGPTIDGKTKVTYTITLQEGETFDLDTVIRNNGTYNAKLNDLTLAGHESYAGLITYTSSGIQQGDVIDAGQTADLKVSVSMGTITNDNIGLLENGASLSLTLVAEFVQAD